MSDFEDAFKIHIRQMNRTRKTKFIARMKAHSILNQILGEDIETDIINTDNPPTMR